MAAMMIFSQMFPFVSLGIPYTMTGRYLFLKQDCILIWCKMGKRCHNEAICEAWNRLSKGPFSASWVVTAIAISSVINPLAQVDL